MKNYYDILGISKTASKDEIKQAFRKLAIENHPDKGGEKEKFQEIQEAYEILSNENKRREYDHGPRLRNSPFTNFDFFFNMETRESIQKKANHHYNCDITLEEVNTGITKKIKVKKETICKKCYDICNECNGKGHINKILQMGSFIQHIQQTCNLCKGIGIKNENENKNSCNCTNGKLIEEKIFEIKIPKGVNQNHQIIFSEWGEQPIKENEIAGDLIVTINIKPHKIFKRTGLNLIYETTFTLKESIIGKDLQIEIFDETLNLNSNIFGILNPNKQYIIYGKGLNGENKRGDLYIIVKIEYPDKTLTNKEIEILKKSFDIVNL